MVRAHIWLRKKADMSVEEFGGREWIANNIRTAAVEKLPSVETTVSVSMCFGPM